MHGAHGSNTKGGMRGLDPVRVENSFGKAGIRYKIRVCLGEIRSAKKNSGKVALFVLPFAKGVLPQDPANKVHACVFLVPPTLGSR